MKSNSMLLLWVFENQVPQIKIVDSKLCDIICGSATKRSPPPSATSVVEFRMTWRDAIEKYYILRSIKARHHGEISWNRDTREN